MFMKIFGPGRLSVPARGYINLYGHNFRTSFSPKQLDQSKPTLCKASMGKRNKIYINGPGHMTKMAA